MVSDLSERDHESLQILVIETADQRFGFWVLDLIAVCRPSGITPVVGSSDFFEGITTLRGKLTPVINLRVLLNVPSGHQQIKSRMVTIRGDKCNLAILVDQVIGFISVDVNELETPPEMLFSRFVHYVYKNLDKHIQIFKTETLVKLSEIGRNVEEQEKIESVAGKKNKQ